MIVRLFISKRVFCSLQDGLDCTFVCVAGIWGERERERDRERDREREREISYALHVHVHDKTCDSYFFPEF